MDLVEKLRNLLIKRFKETKRLGKVELLTTFIREKWCIAARFFPHDIFITAYEDDRIEVESPMDHWDGIRDVIWTYKYDRKFDKAKTEEERERIRQEESKFERKAYEDFIQKKYEKYLNDRALNYTARQHIWANEIARRLSSKYGLSVEFLEDEKPGFASIFDSKGMSEGRIIEEVMKRVDAMVEAGKMYSDDKMMNEFLIDRGIEPWKPRRRWHIS